MGKTFMVFAVVLLAAVVAKNGKPRPGNVEGLADLILRNGKIWTVNPRQPIAQAVAVRDGKIIAVGKNADVAQLVGKGTRVIDLEGRLVLPGFNDAHTHFVSGGFALLGINLRDAKDEQDFARRLREYAAKLSKGKWITGGDWDHEAWPSKKHPTKNLIDPVTPDHPVMVSRLDGHIALANSLALKLAGIDKSTPNPQGGEIVKDPGTGEPTGILKDAAQDLLWRVIPSPTEEEYDAALRAAMKHAAERGVTTVQDMATVDDFRAYQRALRRGELTVRVYAFLPSSQLKEMRRLGLQAGFGNEWLRFGGVKIFSDGSMGAGTALFFEPYADDPATCGIQIHPVEELVQMVVEADKAGLQIALHAIGDRANHLALNAFEEALRANGRRDSRHRIEHAQVVTPEDLPRFTQLGVIASIEPSHCIDDMRWAEKRIGRERCRNAYRFKSFAEAGARLAFGTDWTVEPLDPMLGLYAAATREYPEGGPPGGWFPEEKITLAQAIEFYTLGSAYAEFMDRAKGSIEVGKLADVVVLSKDILGAAAPEILHTKVVYTIVGGKVVYEGR